MSAPTPRQLREVLARARANGCTCTPTLTCYEVAPRVSYLQIAHEEWCGHDTHPVGCRCILCSIGRGPAPTQPAAAA